MILIIGGAYQGKLTFAQKNFPGKTWIDGRDCDLEEVYCCQGIHHFEVYIKRILEEDGEIQRRLIPRMLSENPHMLVICREVGSGIIPMEKKEREYREAVGRILTALAYHGEKVYRIFCGVGTLLKEDKREDVLKLYLIRHGQTQGNMEKRFLGGRTDEPLCESGKKEILEKKKKGYPRVEKVFVSPMIRCRETAALIYPKHAQEVVEELRECDFGDFENKTAEEMKEDPRFQDWMDSQGTLPFPGGESMKEASLRGIKGMKRVVAQCKREGIKEAAIMIHGGIIMGILQRVGVPAMNYYDYYTDNGEGYVLFIDRNCTGIFDGSGLWGSQGALPSGSVDWCMDQGIHQNYQKLFTEK